MLRSLSTLLLAAVVFMVMVTGCGGGGDTTPTGPGSILHPEDLVPEVTVQVVDHNWRTSGWTSENLNTDPVFSLIASATSSLDIAVTRINRQQVVDALINEAKSGTQIRIVTEKAYYDDPTYLPFYAQLEDLTNSMGNIVVHTDGEGLPRTMHDRFIVIDHARVVTGSYNWESVTNEHTFGDVISILNTNVAAAFTNQFNQMFVENRFGVSKRDDTQHSFLVGSGNGMIEVYFGPTDQPRDRMLNEVGQSDNVFLFVEQFKDVDFANSIFNWLTSNTNKRLVAFVNDIADLGNAEDNAVYQALADYTQNPTGGELYINTLIDPTGLLNEVNAMNHKLLVTDHALSNGTPSIMFSTLNYSQMGFTQNDEVLLIMRGEPLINKWWRGIDLSSTMPPANIQTAADIQEIDAVLAMYPFVASTGATLLRGFADASCGIIFGQVDNFRPTVTIQGDNATFEDVDIDLTFEIEGATYFGDTPYGPLPPEITGDMFVRSATANPDNRFLLVVPAGDVTIRTVVTDLNGDPNLLFTPDETTFQIGPGCVREINLNINQAQSGTGGGGGGGGGGGAA